MPSELAVKIIEQFFEWERIGVFDRGISATERGMMEMTIDTILLSTRAPVPTEPATTDGTEDERWNEYVPAPAFTPEPESPRVCVKCGHDNYDADQGFCIANAPASKDQIWCGCACTFPEVAR